MVLQVDVGTMIQQHFERNEDRERGCIVVAHVRKPVQGRVTVGVRAFTSAPADNNASALSKSPVDTAKCNGVLAYQSRASTSAPADNELRPYRCRRTG